MSNIKITTSDWRAVFKKTIDCSRHYRGSQRVRCVFYNPEFYNHGVKGVAKVARPPHFYSRLLLKIILNASIGCALLVIAVYYVPIVITALLPADVGIVEQLESTGSSELWPSLADMNLADHVIFQPNLEQNYRGQEIQPRYDLNLPAGRWLRAQGAGIAAEVLTNNDPSDIDEIDGLMRQGAYLYPQYSELGRRGRTVILASHHFNMFVSASDRPKTFQNLDKVKAGDIIEMIDDYKVWTYEVYKIEKAEAISESVADLIAYTCVYWWDSKLRLFVYARLIPTP